MTHHRPADDRGQADLGWLRSRHTFSFGQYHDPEHMGFGPLRVINQDTVMGGGGFDTHGHRDMEILSWVIDGALEHRDSMGNGSVIRAGEIQLMSAGTGIRHSEFNADAVEPVNFLQIWIEPDRSGHAPGYQQNLVNVDDRVAVIASPDGRDGSVTLHQDAYVFAARACTAALRLEHSVGPRRGLWLQVIRGDLQVDGVALAPGDGVSRDSDGTMVIEALPGSEFLLFDLPMALPA